MSLRKFHIWLRCQSGVTALEYGILASGVGLAVLVVVFLTGEDLNSIFEALLGYMDQE